MPQHAISFGGSQFHYRGYRYDKLEDAVAYAELQAPRLNDDRKPLPH